MVTKKLLSWCEAWDKVLRGDIVSADAVEEGFDCFLRLMSHTFGRTMVDSGIGDYRTFSLN